MANVPPEQIVIDLMQFADRVKDRFAEFTVEFIQDINREIVLATPVDTGFLRANWTASISGTASPGGGGLDKSGGATISQLNLVAAQMVPGMVYEMTNGAKYAMRLEYGFVGADSLGRHYNQAPRFFVRGVVHRASAIAEAVINRMQA